MSDAFTQGESLLVLLDATGRLLDGPCEDKADLMDELISAYDRCRELGIDA